MPALPGPPDDTPKGLAAVLARIEERLSALEASLVEDKAAINEQQDSIRNRRADIEKLEWAVRHGRKRPW